MTKPEIFRRCPYCDVSIRARASFCPQCGKALEDPEKTAIAVEEPRTHISDPAISHQKTIADRGEQRSEQPTLILDERARNKAAGVRSLDSKLRAQAPLTSDGSHAHNKMEKVEAVSSEVFPDSSYDPSLRFLLVAAVLFILFLIILFLSKWIG